MKRMNLESMQKISASGCASEAIGVGLAILGIAGAMGSGGVLTGIALAGFGYSYSSYLECSQAAIDSER